MHRSDLRLSLRCLPLIMNLRELLPFGLTIRPHAVTAKANGGERKRTAGRDRVEVSIHLREEGLRFKYGGQNICL